MKFGICCHPTSLGAEASFQDDIAALQAATVEYLEFPVAAVSPEGSESDFVDLQRRLDGAALKVEAFNGFLPGHHRITGPDVDLGKVLAFCGVALPRCKALGGDVVVLGSAGARKVPDGFDLLEAERQFVAFCREVAPIAAQAGITICIEPLNAREDNLILSVAHGARIVDEVAQPSIQLLADFYHMMEENEPLENVVEAGGRLRHTHLADVGRVAPGFAVGAEADFTGFFRALKASGYEGSTPSARCSFEGSYDDMLSQTPSMIALLKERYAMA